MSAWVGDEGGVDEEADIGREGVEEWRLALEVRLGGYGEGGSFGTSKERMTEGR